MSPQLVIASAPYTVYPGGIVAVRAADWLGAARGTLSTEADARSVCGTVVRDAQKVTSQLQTFPGDNAYNEADATLVIPLDEIGLEEEISRYVVLASVLIEGDWDPTDGTQSASSTQENHVYSCAFAFKWTGIPGSYSGPVEPNFQPRLIDSYRIIGYGGNWALEKPSHTASWADEGDMTWKAYSRNGSTIEYLIDQLYFIPAQSQPSGGPWTSADLIIIPGQASTFGQYTLVPGDTGFLGDYIDGADGGDGNGKFTWHPAVFDQPTAISGADGGGDYQKDDSEYVARVVGYAELGGDEFSDFYDLADSTKTYPDIEPSSSYCYGIHGPFYVPAQVWMEDDFARTIGDNNFSGADGHFESQVGWGLGPQGFYWAFLGTDVGPYTQGAYRYGSTTYVDGSSAAWQNQTEAFGSTRSSRLQLTPSSNGGGIIADNYIVSGKVTGEASRAPDISGLLEHVDAVVTTGSGFLFQGEQRIELSFSFEDATWKLVAALEEVHSASFPGGLGLNDTLAFKIEVKRYLLRVKVWDPGGAEPSTWNYEDFRWLGSPSYPPEAYDYTDNLEIATREWDRLTVQLFMNARLETPDYARVLWDDIKVEYDPYGDNESAHALMEQPEGNEVGRIEMPAGCQHLVYWGNRDWTEFFPSDWSYVDFSAKVWNDPLAAELQRSEAVWWWLRSARSNPTLISMNWRSDTRYPAGVTRVHGA